MKDSWDDPSDEESVNSEIHDLSEKSSDAIESELSTDQLPSPKLRPPIVCVVGHVDAGKTKLLDAIRMTNIGEKEAGGITQSIGATFIESPPLLLIDTPGHESFYNLRECGTNACDIAVVVVDITQGLKPQTIESLKLLRETKTPFVVALNKTDLLYGWKQVVDLDSQEPNVQIEFRDKLDKIICQFAEQGFNAVLVTENKNVKKYVSIVPVSANQGYGIRFLCQVVSKLSEKLLHKQLIAKPELECIVLDVNFTKSFGFVMDTILVNGILKKDSLFIVNGRNGPIKSKIKSLIRGDTSFNLINQSTAVRIIADSIDMVIPGSRLYVYNASNMKEYEEKVVGVIESIDTVPGGVHIQSKSFGGIIAFAHFLEGNKISIGSWGIGNLNKIDLRKVVVGGGKVVLAFDIPISKDSLAFAKENTIQIFSDKVIYKLLEKYNKYQEDLLEQLRRESVESAVFPCRLEILENYVFNIRNPIICGVRVVEGIVKVGTPVCISKKGLELGKIVSIEKDHSPVKEGKAGDQLAVKIEGSEYELGRHFMIDDQLVSQISRKSIDALKNVYSQKDLKREIWMLVAQLKKELHIE